MITASSRVARVRAVVVAVLWLDVVGVAVLVVALVRPGRPGAWVAVLAVLTLHVVVHALGLYAAVTPWWEQRARDVLAVGLVVVTALAAPVLAATGAPGEEPWAWLVGFSVGALTVLRWPVALAALAAGLLTLLTGVGVGAGSVGEAVAFAALGAGLAGGFTQLVVWMLGVVVSAEDGREARARLAVADERLRVAQELHDVLGHRLTVLALRAELSSDVESQELANRTLSEVRAVVHGYGTVDLDEQLRGAELVLASAGIVAEVTTSPVRLDAPRSQLLGAAVREAVTNVLRHSAARCCWIVLDEEDGVVRLSVDNDGVDDDGVDDDGVDATRALGGGTGLSGLAERAGLLGGSLHTRCDGRRFSLTLEAPR